MEPSRLIKSYSVRLEPDGKFELPADFREDFELQPGDQLSLVRVNGYWIISVRPLTVPEMADTIARLREMTGVSLEDLMETGRKVRAQLFEEQYGDLIHE